MGNGFISCCDAFNATQLNEFSLSSPKNRLSPTPDLSRCEIRPPSINSLDYYTSSSQERIRALSALQTSKSLQLKVVNTGNIPKGTKLLITPKGLEGSFRQPNDGYSFFGSKKKHLGVTVNDFVIPIKDNQTELHRGRHFLVYFHLEKQSYWIKDLSKGYGAFVRLDQALLLKENMLVNIGESFVVVNILETTLPKLVLKIFSQKVSGEIWQGIFSSFEVDKYQNTYISIGRNKVCTVKVDDRLLSKIQTSIFYMKGQGWMMIDGDLKGQKPSTNGTWLYLNEDFEIKTGMVFKAHQTLFQVRYIQATLF